MSQRAGQAINTVYPETTVQCLVHLIRNSLDYTAGRIASWRPRPQADLFSRQQARGRRGAPFFVFPLKMQLRKIIKTCGHFPNDESAIKLR